MDNEILENKDASIAIYAQEGFIHIMLHLPNADTQLLKDKLMDEMKRIKEDLE